MNEEAYCTELDDKDEKIRKALINVFATHKDYEIFFGVSVENILAWLEKQGKQKANEIYPIFMVGDYIRNKKTSDKVLIEQLITDKIVYVVTRSEEHSDYVEAVFSKRENAEEYCKQFNDNEDEYFRNITETIIKDL